MKRLPALVLALLLAAGATLDAQVATEPVPPGPPDVVRGTVTSDSAGPVVGASVIVTRGPDRLVQQTTTDSAGRWSLRFEPGTGDYLVYVSLPPYKSARRRVQRQATERELVADFVLAVDVATLAAVRVQANRPVRASNPIGPVQPEPGSSERWADGVQGQLPPSVAGDLNALAGTMSGITMTAGGPSILGAGPESNLTTLNGMGLAASQIPRAARTETRVTGATFDVTRGGFAGANIDVRLGPGSRNFQRRNAFLTLDPPQLQFTDRVGQSLGARNGGLRGSVGADGELIRQALTYNVALDVGRNTGDAVSLFDADREALLRAGVSPDSVARLALVAGPIGLPTPSLNDGRERTSFAWLGRLDDTRDTLSTRALTSYVGYSRDASLGVGSLTARLAGGEREEKTYGAQLTLGTFTGPGRRILTETRLAASRTSTATDPYATIPGANVLVRSPGAESGETDVSSLAIGGAPFLDNSERRWTLEGANETIWNAGGRRHRFKALLSGRMDGLDQEVAGNTLGTFTFNSIDDFAAGRPSSFSRVLDQPARTGSVWNAAGALAHQWLPSRWFNLIYGARVEANGFGDRPAANPALEQALGVATGLAPTRLHVSPRVGFTWTYNRDRENGQGTMQNNVGRFYRLQSGVVRGGIGEFRDMLRPGIVAEASASTGLPGSTSMLSCVGDAVPAVDWQAFAADPSTIPTQCLDGAGPLVERAPSVLLIGEDYDVPRSWRGSLDWSTNIGSWLLKLGGLASYDLNQPGTIDANFDATPAFALSAGEGSRPVYVSPAAIDPQSGAVSAAESRRSNEFGRVSVRTSDLRGYGGQLTVGLAPDPFKFRGRHSLFWGTNYTLQQSKRQYRGFDGAGFGDPREREWAPNANDARHVFVLTGGVSSGKIGTLTLFGRLQSGLPFTPVVQGDLNGDGRGGDRAFVPAFREQSNELAGALAALHRNGSSAAAECLETFEGQVAARNGCRGPWTQTLNMQWRPPIPRRWMRRVTANVYLQNVLGGVDQLVNGSNLRGWGSQAQPDPVLLVPRAFDPAAGQFTYDVNPRFAETRPSRSMLRSPFRLSIDFSVDLSVNYDLQQLRRALEPVRGPDRKWTRRGADSITAFYLRNTSSIHKMLMSESDSLFLSKAQYERLRIADSVYSAQVRGIFLPIGEYLASVGDREPGKAEMDSVEAAQKAYWKVFWQQPEIADSVLTTTQRSLMPMMQRMVAIPQRERENSQWQFGFPVSMLINPPPPQPRGR